MSSKKLVFFEGAKLMKKESFSTHRCTSTHNSIFEEDMVSAIVTGNLSQHIISTAESGNGTKVFLKVFHIAQLVSNEQLDDNIWLFVKQAKKVSNIAGKNEYILPAFQDNRHPLQALVLSTSIRKVATIHIFTQHCQLRDNGGYTSLNHDKNKVHYRILSRNDGFPPQMG